MDKLRTTKVAREIQKELGRIFQEETQKMKGVIVSVTEVRLSPDLGMARAFLSIFPDNKEEEIMSNIKGNTAQIRYELGRRMGKQLRIIPELIFDLDTSQAYAARIDELLGINNPHSDHE